MARAGSSIEAAFDAALSEPQRLEFRAPELARKLRGLLARAQAAWPDVRLAPESFGAYIAARVPSGVPLGDALDAVNGPDLFLAAACAAGQLRAIQHFDELYLSSAAYLPVAARRTADPEVLQQIREHIFVARPGEVPRIAQYAGRAPLGTWLRMVAARLVIDRHRGEGTVGQEPPLDLAASGANPEDQLLGATYQAQLRSSFEATLATLSPRDQSLLRLHFIEGQSADAIGRVYGVAGRTVRRWLADVRQSVLAHVRLRLKNDHRVPASHLASLERFAAGHLQITVSGLLSKRIK